MKSVEQRALDFATERHGDQKYGAEPYTVHLMAVHRVAVDHDLPPDIRIAAFLHDVLEDTNTTPAELDVLFGKPVSSLVLAVTGRGRTRKERNANAYEKIIERGSMAGLLKLCDRIANAEASQRGANKPGATVNDRRLLTMYRDEMPGFEDMVRKALKNYDNPATWVLMMARLKDALA